MKFPVLTVLISLTVLEAALAVPPARITLFCNSLKFTPAKSGTQTLSLTTDRNLTEMTGELLSLSDPSLPNHGSLFVLDDPAVGGSFSGQIYFDTPDPTDANGNGFDDFLEVDQPVASVATAGLYSTDIDQGTVRADWSRAAGSSLGACTVRMTSQSFGQLTPFTFSFEVITYKGEITYRTTTNSVTASLSLTNFLDPSRTLSGAATFIRVSGTNRFNDLTLLPGSLTSAGGGTMSYPAEDIQRDPNLKTNYYGFLDFADGDLSTSTPDYLTWTFSLDDENDANSDGVPDFSDDPKSEVLGSPKLSVIQANGVLLVTVASDTLATFDLESTVRLGTTNWSRVNSIALTNVQQSWTLPLPDSATRFWRLRSP